MSRKSKAEYIGEKRRAYACASAAKRRQILDEVCETLCYTRKYVIKLMTGTSAMRPTGANGDRSGHPAEAALHPDGETANASEPLKINVGAAIRRPQLRCLG